MFKPLLTTIDAGRARLSAALPPLAMPDQVMVRGQNRPLKVRVHPRAKRMNLRFDQRTGDGKVTVPNGTPASAVLTFLSQSRSWIDTHAPEIATKTDRPFLDVLPLEGQDFRIIPTGRIRGTVTRIREYGGECELHVPGAPHRIMPRIKQYLKMQSEQELTPLVMTLAEQLGKQPSAIRYRDPRSQWGSCSSSRVITLSWRVMMASPPAQHYLVAHEVAHLAQMNHSPNFWAVVEQLDPNWKAGRKALKACEKQLLAISFD